MHVMFHPPFRFAVVVVVGCTLVTAGCRSTRNGLSALPGMSWLAADQGDTFPGWAGDSSEPGLPPPSEDATPQVASDGETRSLGEENSYADTGYPSPYGDGQSAGTFDTADVSKDDRFSSSAQPSPSSAASVGSTQQGFYSDNYPDSNSYSDRNSQPSYGDPGYGDDPADSYGDADSYGELATPYSEGPGPANDVSNQYDDYAAPYESTDSEYASDADPSFEQLGQSPDLGVDPPVDDAQTDLHVPQEDSGLRDGYERFSQGVRDRIRGGTETLNQGADRVQSFARDQADNVRQSVRDNYGRIRSADEAAGHELPPATDLSTDDRRYDEPSEAGDYSSVEDYPPANSGQQYDLPDYQSQSYDDYAESSTPGSYGQQDDQVRDLAAPAHDAQTQLNPPQFENYDQAAPNHSAPNYSAPRERSTRPWRPGSTGWDRAIGDDQSTRPRHRDDGVRPASFGRNTPAAGDARQRSHAYPDDGWQTHPTEAQRLSPNYR